MLRRYNTGFEDGKYSVVAGHIDGGETVLAAAVRESREEVGVEIQEKDLQMVGVMHRLYGEERIDFFASIDRWSGVISNCEPHKCDDLRWAPFDDLPRPTVPYVARSISFLEGGDWFQTFGWDE